MAWGTEPVPLAPSSHYEYVDRPLRDRGWSVAYTSLWIVSIIFGVFGWLHSNPLFFSLDESILNNPDSCPIKKGRGLLEEDQTDPPDFDVTDFATNSITWLFISCGLALVVGFVFLHGFKKSSHVMTRAAVYSQIFVPLTFACAALFAGQFVGFITFSMLSGLIALVFYVWRREIALASQLLSVSAHSLVANPHLITTAVVLNVIALLIISPLAVVGVVSMSNGALIPNPLRAGSAKCFDESTGAKVLCCQWQPDRWVAPYVVTVAMLVLWTMLLANQIRVYVVSGTVAQWYFAPVDTPTTSGTTRRSLSQALSSSFGSLCFGSLVLTFTEVMKNSVENAHRQNGGSIFSLIFYVIAQCFYGLVEYLTKFATVMCAITGQGLVDAGRKVTDLLVRNFLDAWASTVWFTPMVIQLAAFSISVAWGFASWGSYYAFHSSDTELYHSSNSIVVGVLSGVFTLFVLNFLGGVLLSVLDAVFICWAIDRDASTVSHPEVYEVFAAVPLKGAVVEQPDGHVHYGAYQPV